MKNTYPIIGHINVGQFGTIPLLDIPMREDAKDKKAPCVTASQSTTQGT